MNAQDILDLLTIRQTSKNYIDIGGITESSLYTKGEAQELLCKLLDITSELSTAIVNTKEIK